MQRIAPPAPRGLRVGLWGCGHLGKQLADLCREGKAGDVQVVGILARSTSTALLETASLLNARACTNLADLLALGPDVVLEAASASALAELGPAILDAGVDLVALSPSCLADASVEDAFRRAAARSGRTLYLPPASADGVDFLAATRHDGLDRALVTVTWRPSAEVPETAGATERRRIFAGSAREATRRYPRHLNFVVALALAGAGLDATTVHIEVDPSAAHTSYVLDVDSPAATLRAAVGLRRPGGRQGRLAVLSGLETLRRLAAGGAG